MGRAAEAAGLAGGHEMDYSVAKTIIVGIPADDPRHHTPISQEIGSNGKPKRNTFACTSCHAVKQRCIPTDMGDIYRKPCSRCVKLRKPCEFDLSKRTRRKRRAAGARPRRRAGRARERAAVRWAGRGAPLSPASGLAAPPPLEGGAEADGLTEAEEEEDAQAQLARELARVDGSARRLEALAEMLAAESRGWGAFLEGSAAVPTLSDPVSLGIVTLAEAEYRLDCYREVVAGGMRLPFLRVPKSCTAEQLRVEQPILFATVLSMASLVLPGAAGQEVVNMKLDNFVLTLVTHYCMRIGDRTVELLKSLILLCMWCNYPEWSHKTRYHYFNYLCCNLVRDLGMPYAYRPILVGEDEGQQRKLSAMLEQDPEYPRLILLAYIISLNMSVFLQQPIQFHWSPVVEKACSDILDARYVSELYSAEDNQMLMLFAKLHLCMERAYSMQRVNSGYSFVAADNDDTFCSLFRELEGIKMQMPKHYCTGYILTVEAYVYESAVSCYLLRNGALNYPLPDNISDAFLTATERSVAAMKDLLSSGNDIIPSIQLLGASRIIYTMGMSLLKLRYNALTMPAFEPLRSSTEEILPLLQRIATFLDQLHESYPYNRSISKLQYVSALFLHTYHQKIKKCIYRQETTTFPTLCMPVTPTLDRSSPSSAQLLSESLGFANIPTGTNNDIQAGLLRAPSSIIEPDEKKFHTIKVNSIYKHIAGTPSAEFSGGQLFCEPSSAPHSVDYLSDYLMDNAFVESDYDAFNDEVYGTAFFPQLK